jgi:hypothetical protein
LLKIGGALDIICGGGCRGCTTVKERPTPGGVDLVYCPIKLNGLCIPNKNVFPSE